MPAEISVAFDINLINSDLLHEFNSNFSHIYIFIDLEPMKGNLSNLLLHTLQLLTERLEQHII